MKKNKGFTLIELMTVIVILGVIVSIAFPIVNGVLDSSNEKLYQSQLKSIEEAAKKMSLENTLLLREDGTTCISISDIITSGFIENSQIKDPRNDSNITGSIAITYDSNYKNYKYTYVTECNPDYVKDGLILHYDGKVAPVDNTWSDLSGNENDAIISGATYLNNSLNFDGVDDYAYVEEMDYGNTNTFSFEFVSEISNPNSIACILFESSVNSNNDEGAFYIDSFEYGTNDLTLAMKFLSNTFRNHKYVDGILSEGRNSYTLTFDSTKTRDNYISIYKNGILYNGITPINSIADNDLFNRTLKTNPLYISSRAGQRLFSKQNISSVRIYNRALTAEEINYNYSVDRKKYNF